jgi:hypothetical protein
MTLADPATESALTTAFLSTGPDQVNGTIPHLRIPPLATKGGL